MPKSKTDKKRKKKVVAFKLKIKADKKKMSEAYLKGLQDLQYKQMEDKVNSEQTENVEDLGLENFSLENNTPEIKNEDLMGLGDIEQVELTGAPPDSFAGVIK